MKGASGKMRGWSGIFLCAVMLAALLISSTLVIAAQKTAELPTVNWRCQSFTPPPESIVPGSKYRSVYGMTLKIARTVKEKTNGKFNIKVYTPGTLFKTKGIFPAIRAGAIEMSSFNGGYVKGTVPSGAIESISVGGARDARDLIPMVLESDWLKIVRRDYAKFGVYYGGSLPCGTATFMTNFPIHSVADIKGRKIAASGAKGDLLKLLGGNPVVVHATDMYSSLQRGTVDGITFPAYTLSSYKFYEVVKYMIWAGIQNPLSCNIIINLGAYDKLPKQYQDALNEACLETTIYQLSVGNKMDDIARDVARKHGIKQIVLSDEAFDEVKEGFLKIWDRYGAKTKDNARLVALLKEYCGY